MEVEAPETDRTIAALIEKSPRRATELRRLLGVTIRRMHIILWNLKKQGCVRRERCPCCGQTMGFSFVKVQRSKGGAR